MPEFDGATRARVVWPRQLEEVQDVFCGRCRPKGEERVVRIREGATAADRHKTRVTFFREDQPSPPLLASANRLVRSGIEIVVG